MPALSRLDLAPSEVDDFVDVTDADLRECGLKPIEIKRLRRHLGSEPSMDAV